MSDKRLKHRIARNKRREQRKKQKSAGPCAWLLSVRWPAWGLHMDVCATMSAGFRKTGSWTGSISGQWTYPG